MDLTESLKAALSSEYEIERELGGGGMARVFLARERRLGRPVVIKTVAPELIGDLSTSRFEREMTLAASLQHPHILPVLSAGVAGDVPYYTMPFVEGSTLRARLDRESRLPIDDVARILTHLALAMAYAHNHDVIHRDIKPDNILLSDGIAVVTDFGVAKALSMAQPHGATLTSAGTAIGTPAYMAPEQAAGDACDARADIYAFGVVAYEMLVGTRPFEHASIQRLIAAQLIETPKHVSLHRDDIPAELADLVMRCLAKEPALRPASSQELVSVLRTFGSGSLPRTMRRQRRLPVLALAAAALILMAGFFASRFIGGRSAVTPTSAPASAAIAPAIAVLPFENLGADSASEYFSDGMTDEVLQTLTRMPALRVASRATSFAYKGKREDPREIAAKLRVQTLLTGSVRRTRDSVRISAQLVDGRDGSPLWSETYERPLLDVFEIQGDIARAIATALRLTLTPQDTLRPPPTRDPVAYDLYLKGRQALRYASDSVSRQTAVDYFHRAVQRDPQFALAFAYLAQGYLLLNDDVAAPRVLPRARDAALKAVRLDPTLIDAGISLADIRINYDWDWTAAEREYRRVLALDSMSIDGHLAYAGFLRASRRYDEALAETEAAIRAEKMRSVQTPRLLASQERRLGWAKRDAGRLDESREHYRRALAIDSGSGARWAYGLGLMAAGHAEEAVHHLQLADRQLNGTYPVRTHLGLAYALSGQRDSARAILNVLLQRSSHHYVPKDQLSALSLALGDTTAALRWLDQAVKEHHYWLPNINGNFMFDGLRQNSHFRLLMRKIGAPDG